MAFKKGKLVVTRKKVGQRASTKRTKALGNKTRA